MKKTVIVLAVLLLIVLLGCNKEPVEEASILSASLVPDSIKSGETADLVLDAKNSGELPMTVIFNATTEAPDRVIFEYPMKLSFALQPGETTGKKIVKVTATSDTVRTDYMIHVAINDEKGNVYDEGNVVLTVRK